MKKSIILAAVAALVLASCAKTETYVKATFDDAVTFGAYSGRTITKAGPTDDMNLDALKQHGFGVFATYSGTADFTKATDDFMYNQQVAYNGTEWAYTPVKYWPNPTNGQAADAQKVSFFAYAPYATSTDWTAETVGITGFSIDPTTKHNLVHYGFSNAKDTPNVDLMWGYKAKDTSTDPATYTINNNLTRTTDKVSFIFQHLLSKLGGSQEGEITDPTAAGYVANGLIIKANAETVTPTNLFGTATGTKITVSKIIMESAPETEGTPAVAVTDIDGDDIHYAAGVQTGKLDLYTGEFVLDSTPGQAVQFKQTITNDPDEVTAGNADSELATIIAEPASFANFGALPTGVTDKAVNVYKDESSPIILVPGTKPVVDITITYTVRTWDEKLPNKYTDVEQTVWGRVKFPAIEKNKKYNLLMILGLNDVKFEASVEDWSIAGQTWNDADGDGVIDDGELTGNDVEIGLPNNLPLFNLASAANVVVDANGDGETGVVYSEAASEITITGITKDGNPFDNSANNFTVNTTDKKIVLDNVAAGTYVLTMKAVDEHHDEAVKAITITVTNA